MMGPISLYNRVLECHGLQEEENRQRYRRRQRRRRRRQQRSNQLWNVVALLVTYWSSRDTASNRLSVFAEEAVEDQDDSNYYDYDNTGKEYFLQFHSLSCAKHLVKVNSMSLSCDSPGSYSNNKNYQKSSSDKYYRNSQVCMSGDRANLKLYVTIADGFESSTIYVTIDSGIYDDHFTMVISNNFCQMGISGDNAYQCPAPGSYEINAYFAVPYIRDYNFHYTPDIRIAFYDGDDLQYYDTNTIESYREIGCATSGTSAMRSHGDDKAKAGLIALGISVVAFIIVFGVLLHLTRRRRGSLKQTELVDEQKSGAGQPGTHYSIHAQPHQLPPSMATRYMPTSPSGQVQVHFPPRSMSHRSRQGGMPRLETVPSGASSSEDPNAGNLVEDSGDDAEDALNISNPSYNVPQVPTRPII